MISDRCVDKCESCGETAAVRVYSVPTNAFMAGESKALTTAIWCDSCAELHRHLIISDGELRVLAGRNKPDVDR